MKQRLTYIETLPGEAVKHVLWLYNTILARRMSQTDMLEEFNRRLLAMGEKPASLSGLNRYAIKVRDGAVRRPQVIATGDEAVDITAVFSAEFREKLLKNQGEKAVSALETTLTALAS